MHAETATAPARTPRVSAASRQDGLPSHYSFGVRALSMLAFGYVAFSYLNGRFLHLLEKETGQPPVWLGSWTEYLIIILFGVWRTWAERNPYTRKRLAFLTAAVGVFWWFLPAVLRLPEPHVGALPGQPIFPQIHAPGTLTFFAVLLLVLLFGRRVICGWNCPCVAIRETVGFAFRQYTPRSATAWNWRHAKWLFFAGYMVIFVLIIFSGTAYVSPVYGGFLALVGITYFGSFFIAPLTGNRFYCRYLCPYGATFGLLNHIGFYGIRMDMDACVDCRRCEQVCDMGIPVWQQGKAHGRVTGLADCMGCGRCVLSCPTDALEFRDVRNEFLPGLRMDGSHLLGRSAPPELAARVEPALRPPPARRADWGEEHVPLGLATAQEQARRCLDCGVPGCRNACPLGNRIPEWLEALGQGDIRLAATISNATSPLPEICGAVCPTQRLCEGDCTLNGAGGPVIIGALERFVTEEALRQGWAPQRARAPACGRSAAIIGAGPAGLACAGELSQAGFDVTVFDRRDQVGGLLTYGIPPFKLDKTTILRRKALLEDAGIRFDLGVDVDAERLARLIADNDAVFLGTGAQTPRRTGLPGQDLVGVTHGIGYLSALGSGQPDVHGVAGKRAVVLGGGDTALDCARSAVRQGAATVTVAYRRSPEHMRAAPKDIAAAHEEGVGFVFHHRPLAFTGRDRLEAVRFDGPKGTSGSLPCDVAIIAFGQAPDNVDWLRGLGIATDEGGFVITDETGRTSNLKVFAAGDNSHGPSLVVMAVAAAAHAARGIVGA